MYSTEGIILKRTDIGEADSLFSIYTKEFGKVRARAQGVKKEDAKLKGHLEPLNMSAITFVLGKNGERLTHASLLHYWPSIRENYEKLAFASYIAAMTDAHCFPGQQDERIWNLLISSLIALDSGVYEEGGYRDALRSFGREFLSAMGYEGSEEIGVFEERVARPFPS